MDWSRLSPEERREVSEFYRKNRGAIPPVIGTRSKFKPKAPKRRLRSARPRFLATRGVNS